MVNVKGEKKLDWTKKTAAEGIRDVSKEQQRLQQESDKANLRNGSTLTENLKNSFKTAQNMAENPQIRPEIAPKTENLPKTADVKGQIEQPKAKEERTEKAHEAHSDYIKGQNFYNKLQELYKTEPKPLSKDADGLKSQKSAAKTPADVAPSKHGTQEGKAGGKVVTQQTAYVAGRKAKKSEKSAQPKRRPADNEKEGQGSKVKGQRSRVKVEARVKVGAEVEAKTETNKQASVHAGIVGNADKVSKTQDKKQIAEKDKVEGKDKKGKKSGSVPYARTKAERAAAGGLKSVIDGSPFDAGPPEAEEAAVSKTKEATYEPLDENILGTQLFTNIPQFANCETVRAKAMLNSREVEKRKPDKVKYENWGTNALSIEERILLDPESFIMSTEQRIAEAQQLIGELKDEFIKKSMIGPNGKGMSC